jgi:sugar lactone lactonase YvrE
MQNLQRLPVGQRRLVFFLIFGGLVIGLILITLLLTGQALNAGTRVQSTALVPNVTVRQFATLPDDDAYPSAVVAAPDGTVYTGSYGTGAVWAIDPSGTVRELPNTRAAIGAVSGLAVAPDGAILVVDQIDTDPRSTGGTIQRIALDGTVSAYATTDAGFIAPNDIVFDASGAFFVTDPGRNEVWRFVVGEDDAPQGEVWWVPPTDEDGARNAVTGLAYDPIHDAIIVTDPETNKIYRISIAEGSAETVYRHGERANPPGFDGATVAPDGTLYVAALGQNGIAIVENGDLDYIAGLFRGASDVEYAAPGRLYVTNFDQSSLIVPLLQPQLPFALDVIELNALEVTPSLES